MKITIKNLIVAINLFTIALLFLTVVLNADAQSAKTEKQTEQEKQEEREVTKFAESFFDNFIEKKDLSKISSNFFDKDFTSHFANSDDCMLVNFDKIAKVNPNDRFKIALTFQNFFNVSLMVRSIYFDKKKKEDPNYVDKSHNYLPPQIFEKVKQTKWLNNIIDEDSAGESSNPKNLAEINEFLSEMLSILAIMKTYVETHSLEKSKEYLRLRKKYFEYSQLEPCDGESCLGLPKNTIVYAVHEFHMCLRIAKINGQWKIITIYSVGCEI